MTLPPLLETLLTTLREVVRACCVPVHVALHGLRRKHWQERAREALGAHEQGDDNATDAGRGLAAFAARHAAAPTGRGGHIFVSTGESSGEGHAVNLVHAVARAGHAPRWSAFGGEPLRDAGAKVLYPLSEFAIMGIVGVFKALPKILAAHRRFLELLRDDPPDVVVLLDYPGLHLVMARAARRRGIPVVHYIAPQYWAWGPWRMQRYRKAVDATLTILPFEAPFYAREGIASAYVGHPLLDQLAAHDTVADHDPQRPLLVLMPGSRRKELRLHLGPMVDVARRLRKTHPDLRVVLPHRDPRRAAPIRAALAALGAQDFVEFAEGDPVPWLRAARAALVKSGTGSLEATLCGPPTVVVYVIDGPLPKFALRKLLNVPWFAGANLIANREVVPEFAVESPADWDRVRAAVDARLRDGPDRRDALAGVDLVRHRLGAPGASDRAAQWVAPFCEDKKLESPP